MRIALGQSGGPDPRCASRTLGLMALVLTVVLAGCGPREPSHGGKLLSTWFKEAVEDSAHRWDVEEAFEAMEGDAVPFLVGEIVNARKLLAAAATNPPNPWLMNPAGEAAYWLGFGLKPAGPEIRQNRAYYLLELIAARQRQLTESGKASRKPSITNAFPVLHEGLRDPKLREEAYALRVVEAAGPVAAEFTPLLLGLLTNALPSDARLPNIITALGQLGESAVAAVPHLTAIVADPLQTVSHRSLAAYALGQIGPASQTAAPALAELLMYMHTNLTGRQRFRLTHVVQSLAATGCTPDSAVPVLEEMIADSTNGWLRMSAVVALWNRRPDDPALRTLISSWLTSTNPGPVLFMLTRPGTNAAEFAREIRALTNHPLPQIRAAATRYLRAPGRTTP